MDISMWLLFCMLSLCSTTNTIGARATTVAWKSLRITCCFTRKTVYFRTKKLHEFSNILFIIIGKTLLLLAKSHASQCQELHFTVQQTTLYIVKDNVLHSKS